MPPTNHCTIAPSICVAGAAPSTYTIYLSSCVLYNLCELAWFQPKRSVPAESIMKLKIEVEREDDGRYLAEAPELPGVLAYGQSRQEAVRRVQALALRVIADRLEHNESAPDLPELFAIAA